MREIAASQARDKFGLLLDTLQGEPVRLTRKGTPVGVMMSMQQCERLRGAAWDQLLATMDAIAGEGAANGLNDTKLESLLADASKACRRRP